MPNFKLKTQLVGAEEIVTISTVNILGLFPYGEEKALDILGYGYETMVFNGEMDGYTYRYDNSTAAKNGHGIMTSWVQAAEGLPVKMFLRIK